MTKVQRSKANAPRGNKKKLEAFEKALKEGGANGGQFELTLFITGNTPRSGRAIANIRSICESHLPDQYLLRIIDIYQQPSQAVTQQIVAAPTLVKYRPEPMKRLIGDMADSHRVLSTLDITDTASSTPTSNKA